jgi:hypothetical protein
MMIYCASSLSVSTWKRRIETRVAHGSSNLIAALVKGDAIRKGSIAKQVRTRGAQCGSSKCVHRNRSRGDSIDRF